MTAAPFDHPVERTPAREKRIAAWMQGEREAIEVAFGAEHWPAYEAFINEVPWEADVQKALAQRISTQLFHRPGVQLTREESMATIAAERTLASLNERELQVAMAYYMGVSVEHFASMAQDARDHHEESVDSDECALYRHFDSAGELLYVGIAKKPDLRSQQHAKSASWWRFVDRTEVEWFFDTSEARAAEKDAIQLEQPVFNDVHNRANRTAAIDYMAAALDRLTAAPSE